MPRYGIISDIHGNRHAFDAVLGRLGRLDLDELVCLGDVVGYGPHPDVCLDLVYKHCGVIVLGNHDEAIIDVDADRLFNGPARDAIAWSRDRLGPLHLNAIHRMRRTATPEAGVLCVHASPVAGPRDYIHDPQAAGPAFGGVPGSICLIGHTHVPVVFETAIAEPSCPVEPGAIRGFLPGDGLALPLRDGCRYLCNPGSVGQPRDADPRASFAVLDTDDRTFTVYREPYDVCAAQQAAREAGLPVILAERLALGA